MTIGGRLRWGALRGARETSTERASADRNAAFIERYERTLDAVYRYCRLRIADPIEAEDAAALVFANAFAAFPPARPEVTRSWLFAIAHNVVATTAR